MAKLLSNELINTIKYGVITVQTSQGKIEFEYSTGVDYDAGYNSRTVPDGALLQRLSDDEQDEIDDIIRNEIY